MTDRHQAPAYPLRLPADLKDEVTKAAFVAGRSFNAEVAARLRASFETTPQLPTVVADAVEDEMLARGGTADEALERLVLLGQSQGGTVFQVRVPPGMKLKDVMTLMDAARKVIPPNADIFLDRSD